MGNDEAVRWWKRLRAAVGLLSAAERRAMQRAEIEERMKAILAIPPTRIDAFVVRPDPPGEPSKNGSPGAPHEEANG